MSKLHVYLAKAEESLLGAISELEQSRYNNSTNRAYYACFQAAITALQHASRAVQRTRDFLAVIRAEVMPHAR